LDQDWVADEEIALYSQDFRKASLLFQFLFSSFIICIFRLIHKPWVERSKERESLSEYLYLKPVLTSILPNEYY